MSFEAIHTETSVASIKEDDDGVDVTFEGGPERSEQRFDRVLVAAGRPNSSDIGLDKTGVETDDKGFIKLDEKRRTAGKRIYAVGDVVGGAMLAPGYVDHSSEKFKNLYRLII